jgi:hypothetical protein
MKYYGKAEETAGRILEAFNHPETLPASLAQVFIKRNVPSDTWSWHNRLLCVFQGTTDARGFNQWIDAGRHVKKGSRAISILAPVLVKSEQKDQDSEKNSKTYHLVGFKSIPVFRMEDTDGAELPENQFVEKLPLVEVARVMVHGSATSIPMVL